MHKFHRPSRKRKHRRNIFRLHKQFKKCAIQQSDNSKMRAMNYQIFSTLQKLQKISVNRHNSDLHESNYFFAALECKEEE